MTPHAIFEINGVRYDSWKEKSLFSRVSIELPTNEAAQATWEAFDPEFRLINKYSTSDGVPLATCRVWLGFGQNLGEPVFKGLLARVQRGEKNSTLIAYDMGLKMRLLKKTEYHKGENPAIIRKLAERNELGFKGPANPLKLGAHKSMPQDEQTDWEHVLERAHEDGLVVWVREDTLFADYPAKVGTPRRTLVHKKDFTLYRDFDAAFRVPENVEGRPKKFEVRGRGRGGKRLTGESDKSHRGHEPVSIKKDLSQHTKKRATARAQAQKELDREHAFNPIAYVTAVTNPAAIDSGTETESVASALERMRLLQRRAQRIVSAADLEDAILDEALDGNGVVVAFEFVKSGLFNEAPKAGYTTVVVMTSSGLAVSDEVRDKIESLLDQVVGTQFVTLVGPTYVEFDVSASVRLQAGVTEAAVLASVESRLSDFYAPGRGNFGRDILRSEIIAVIEGTPGVDRIVSNPQGAIILEPLVDTRVDTWKLPKIEEVSLVAVQ